MAELADAIHLNDDQQEDAQREEITSEQQQQPPDDEQEQEQNPSLTTTDPEDLAAQIAQLEKELGLDSDDDDDEEEISPSVNDDEGHGDDGKTEKKEVAPVPLPPPPATKSVVAGTGGASKRSSSKVAGKKAPSKKSNAKKDDASSSSAAAAAAGAERRAMKKQLEDEVDRFVKEMNDWRPSHNKKSIVGDGDSLVVIPRLSDAAPHSTSSSRRKLPPRTAPILFSDVVKRTLGQGRLDSVGSSSSASSPSSTDALASALASVTTIEFTNQGMTDLDAFDCLPGITKAYLGDNHLSSLEGVEVWLGITVLVLHDNDISDLQPLFALRSLRVLDVRRNKLREVDAAVLPETLETLEVAGNVELPAAAAAAAGIDAAAAVAAKEELWEMVSARCPALRSIDVVGTSEEVEKKKRMQNQPEQDEKGDELWGLAKQKQQQQPLSHPRRVCAEDDAEDDDALLCGTSPKNSNDDDVADAVLSAFGAQNTATQQLLASVLSKDEDGNDVAAGAEYDDDEDALEQKDAAEIIKRAMSSKSLEVRLTDADFDEAAAQSSGAAAAGAASVAASSRPSSARVLRPSSARGYVRPSSARGGTGGQSLLSSTHHQQLLRGAAQDEEDEVRLSLPVAGGVCSQVRTVTDDLLRQYDHNIEKRTAQRQHRDANARVESEAAPASDVLNLMDDDDGEANNNNNNTNNEDHPSDSDDEQKQKKQNDDDDGKRKKEQGHLFDTNSEFARDKIIAQQKLEQQHKSGGVAIQQDDDPFFTDQFRDESRGLRKELLFASQHQRRVAEMRVDDMWQESMKELASISVNRAATSALPASAVGEKKNTQHSTAYEKALKVLADSAHTSVEGLEQFRNAATAKK